MWLALLPGTGTGRPGEIPNFRSEIIWCKMRPLVQLYTRKAVRYWCYQLIGSGPRVTCLQDCLILGLDRMEYPVYRTVIEEPCTLITRS